MKWESPCIILEKLNPNKYIIKLVSNGKLFTVHADNISSRSDILLESDKTENIINEESSSMNEQISLNREEGRRITMSETKLMTQEAAKNLYFLLIFYTQLYKQNT